MVNHCTVLYLLRCSQITVARTSDGSSDGSVACTYPFPSMANTNSQRKVHRETRWEKMTHFRMYDALNMVRVLGLLFGPITVADRAHLLRSKALGRYRAITT